MKVLACSKSEISVGLTASRLSRAWLGLGLRSASFEARRQSGRAPGLCWAQA